MVDGPAKVERGPERVEPGQEPRKGRPEDECAGDDEVEEAQEDERCGDGCVTAPLDAPLREQDANGVTAARGDDRADACPGEDRADDLAPGDLRVRIRGLEDVAPRAADAEQPRYVAGDSERERAPAEVREPVEEDLDRMPDRVTQVLGPEPSVSGFMNG
jgi:hypothetical protein